MSERDRLYQLPEEISTIIADMRQRKTEENIPKRQEAADQIEQSRKDREEVVPKLEAAVAKAKEALDEHRRQGEILEAQLRQAQVELMSEKNRIDGLIQRAESILLDSYNPAIYDAMLFLWNKLDEIRRAGVITDRAGGGINIFSLKKNFRILTNKPAVERALAYCQAAVKELEAMRLRPVCDVQRIEILKKGIPSTDEFTEIDGDRELPKPVTNPRDLLPSDSEMDWKKNKLLEKAEKLLKKK